MGKNILFVDIDGPLLPAKYQIFPEYRNFRRDEGLNAQFDLFSVAAHNMIAKWGNCEVVLSTNWKFHKTINDLKYIFNMNGLQFKYHKQESTGRWYGDYQSRARDIMNWVGHYAQSGDKMLVIDDDKDCKLIEERYNMYLENGYFSEFHDFEVMPQIKWIEVDSSEGFTHQNYVDSMDFFGVDWDEIKEVDYGIKRLTKEEKKERDAAFDMLLGCMI